jgi:hypothetical protein
MKIIATVQHAVQIGPEDYTMRAHSREFTESSTLGEIKAWAETHVKPAHISDITFSEKDEPV